MPAEAIAAVVFLATLAASAAATRLVLAWLRHRQILDHPNERSSHQRPTPRGGGLAVTPVILLAWAGLAAAGSRLPGQPQVMAAAAGLLALSWRDDRGHLPAALRLAVHLAAAAVGLAGLDQDRLVFQGLLSWPADRLAALLLWVWFTNLYNFMDGIDGITGVETAAIGLGLALLPGLHGAPQAVAVAAAGLGFLLWNWHPARIFLGDAGSVPLGYLLGWLLLSAAADGQWAAALILPAYYLADASLTLAARALRREPVWQAHRRHFYQRAVQGGASHARVAGLILLADLPLMALAVASAGDPWNALAAAAAVVAGLLGILQLWSSRRRS